MSKFCRLPGKRVYREGNCEKAKRGELVVSAPVGFVKVGDRLEKGKPPVMTALLGLVFS